MQNIKKKIKIIGIATLALTSFNFAASGSFGNHYAQYDSKYTKYSIPLVDDKVSGGTAAHQPGGGYENYAYVRVRVGQESDTYHQDTSYTYDDEWSGTATAYFEDSWWAQTYHKAKCYTCGTPTDYKTINY